jgi:hypothetical protein
MCSNGFCADAAAVDVQRPSPGCRDAVGRAARVGPLEHNDRLDRRLQRLQPVAVSRPGRGQVRRRGGLLIRRPLTAVVAVVLLPVAVTLRVELRRMLPRPDHGALGPGAPVQLGVEPSRLWEARQVVPGEHRRVDDEPGVLDRHGHAVPAARAGKGHPKRTGVEQLPDRGPRLGAERHVAPVPGLPHKPAAGAGERPVGPVLCWGRVRSAEALHDLRQVIGRVAEQGVEGLAVVGRGPVQDIGLVDGVGHLRPPSD